MTIDEIFAALPEEPAQDAHEFLVIDPTTRTIKVPASESIFGVEGDEDGERKYFIAPRYVGDHLDLAACFLSIVYRNANGEKDQYLVEDTAINGEYVTFSWLLSEKVVKYKGAVQFRFDADTAAGPAWGTTMATGTSLEGMEPEIDADTVEGETSDVVTQLRDMVTRQTGNVEAAGAAQVAAVEAQGTASTQEAVAAIQAQGEATNASIPAEYTELEATVDRLTRDRAAAIVCQAEGELLQITDASNDPLHGLRIFGKSTQDGTPTPDNPVEIVSTPAPVVTVCGKNLAAMDCHSGENNYIALVNVEDLRAIKKGKRYTLSVYLHATAATRAYWNNAAKLFGYLEFDVAAGTNRYTYTFTAMDDGALYETTSNLVNKYPANDGVVITATNPQLEFGAVATAYEPYTGQALAITTPGSLPGIPVASGGNYTDANGQQWIADEVDLARGVYVQRTGTRVLNGGEAENWGAYNPAGGEKVFHCYLVMSNYARRWPTTLCDKFCNVASVWEVQEYGLFSDYNTSDLLYFSAPNATVTDMDTWKAWLQANPVTIVYLLATPVEIALTDVELQAFLALHSNKSTTTVLNDAGAHMVLEYAADPKTFICNQIAAAIAAK